ncbi:hypothetical protein [Bacillus sp. JJ1562]|uniref:hypothetical protein n=1 Tax=Bacillus sp. JJ1562 TaxID=3122960 RepID=UPI00300235E7
MAFPKLYKFVEPQLVRSSRKKPGEPSPWHSSLLAEARVSIEQIMDRLGHTDDQISI